MAKIARNGSVALEYSVDGGTTWLNVAGVRSFDPGVASSEDVDVTDYDSPDNQREYENGYKAQGDGSITVNFEEDDASHQALDAAAGGAAIQLRHQYDTRWLTFPALIKSFSKPVSIGEAWVSTITIKAASAPVWSAVT